MWTIGTKKPSGYDPDGFHVSDPQPGVELRNRLSNGPIQSVLMPPVKSDPFPTLQSGVVLMEATVPFPTQESRPFTKAGIEWLAPNQNGVYGIFRQDAWIYVGRGDLRTRLLSHFNGDNPRITRERPTSYVTLVTKNDETMERSLIIELNPIANRRVG
jgi:hypothetical protein